MKNMLMENANLLNFNHQDLCDYFIAIGEKPFRATQVLQWIHQKRITDFTKMSNLSLKLRDYLQQHATVTLPEIVTCQTAQDNTRKYLIKLSDNNFIETVFIPEANRATLCISSQTGCSLQCAFCATATLRCQRNLSVAEIIGQLWLASGTGKITNVVLMGMGEPLLNFDNVVKAIDIMLDDNAYGLSKYRVTLSTSGIVPALYKLRQRTPVALAISLHAPNDELRSQLMPINKKHPLSELIAACKDYFKDEPRRYVTFEYIMLAGINDSKEHAKQLVKLLSKVRCKINLIPYNETPKSNYRCSAPEIIDNFRTILIAAGINTITRKSRGSDIAAACGQLAGKKSRE